MTVPFESDEEAILEQPRLTRILQLIIMMDKPCTVRHMAERLDVSERTILRNFITLQSVGFKIEMHKGKPRRYRICAWPEEFSKIKMEVAA